MSKTKKSHYVWQYYLRNWATLGSIYCSINGNKPIKNSLDNVANKRYFYELAPFNEVEKEFLIKCIDNNLPAGIVSCLVSYLESLDIYFQSQEKRTDFHESINIQFGENLMTSDENSSITIFDNLTRGNIDYCTNKDNIICFYLFVIMQYFRTKRIYDDLANIKEIRVKSIITPFRKIMACNVTNYLISTKSKTILLRNNTPQEFITSDQPVCNTYVDYSILNRHTDKLELYYPITPNIAILISNNDKYNRSSDIFLNIDEVDYYNRKIINSSEMQVYCSKATALDRYIK